MHIGLALTTAAVALPFLVGAGPAEAAATPDLFAGYIAATDDRSFFLVVHEDGSGQLIKHLGDGAITGAGTFDEASLPWECDRNGNAVCGAGVLPEADERSKATSWTTGRYTGTVHTDGTLTVRHYSHGDAGLFVTSVSG